MSTHVPALGLAAPVGRLLWSRRVVLPAIGIASLAGTLGWIGAMIRFSRLTPAPGDPMLAPLVAASALVMLPAAVGILAGDAIQQLARRAALRLLPDLRRRLFVALGAVGAATCLPVALAAAPFRDELTPLTAVAPAALGFVLGARFPGRARSGLAWVAALAFPLLADPLCHITAPPIVALLIVFGAAVSLRSDLGALLTAGAKPAGEVTWLGALAGPKARREAERAARLGKTEIAPPARVADRRGWFAAHRFEHGSLVNSILAPAGTVKFAAVCFTLSLVAPILQGIDMEGPGFRGLFATLVEAYVGPFDGVQRISSSASSTIVVVIWVASALIAAFAGAPLLGHFCYPISRRGQAALAATVARRASLVVFATVLALGGLASAVLLQLLDASWPRGLPTFVWVALVGLATAPWIQVLWLALARYLRRRESRRAWLLFLAGLALPFAAVTGAWGLWANEAGRPVSAPWIAAYVAVLATGWTVHGPLLRRHFSRCDLAG